MSIRLPASTLTRRQPLGTKPKPAQTMTGASAHERTGESGKGKAYTPSHKTILNQPKEDKGNERRNRTFAGAD